MTKRRVTGAVVIFADAGVRPSVCLSVRVSVTFMYSVEASKHILKLFSPSVDPPI